MRCRNGWNDVCRCIRRQRYVVPPRAGRENGYLFHIWDQWCSHRCTYWWLNKPNRCLAMVLLSRCYCYQFSSFHCYISLSRNSFLWQYHGSWYEKTRADILLDVIPLQGESKHDERITHAGLFVWILYVELPIGLAHLLVLHISLDIHQCSPCHFPSHHLHQIPPFQKRTYWYLFRYLPHYRKHNWRALCWSCFRCKYVPHGPTT